MHCRRCRCYRFCRCYRCVVRRGPHPHQLMGRRYERLHAALPVSLGQLCRRRRRRLRLHAPCRPCSDVDAFSFANQDALILFASGNDGAAGARSVVAPGTAKNCLTVGATMSSSDSFALLGENCPASGTCYENVADFSSQGPTWDGRCVSAQRSVQPSRTVPHRAAVLDAQPRQHQARRPGAGAFHLLCQEPGRPHHHPL